MHKKRAVSFHSLFYFSSGCTLQVRRNPYTVASAGFPLPSGSSSAAYHCAACTPCCLLTTSLFVCRKLSSTVRQIKKRRKKSLRHTSSIVLIIQTGRPVHRHPSFSPIPSPHFYCTRLTWLLLPSSPLLPPVSPL